MTRALFSTKAFVPGHLLGTCLLLFGTIALAQWVIARGRAQRSDARRGLSNSGRYLEAATP